MHYSACPIDNHATTATLGEHCNICDCPTRNTWRPCLTFSPILLQTFHGKCPRCLHFHYELYIFIVIYHPLSVRQVLPNHNHSPKLTVVVGAIRCYCNREECKKEYTCISYVEKCYSKLFTVYAHENKTAVLKQPSKDEHGCVDLVSSQKRGSTLCDGQGDVVKQLKELEPLIMCCSDRMCNYRKSQDIHVDIVDPETIRQG